MHYLGIDVSKASHQCVILDAEGEALGKSFTIQSSKDDFANLVKLLTALAASGRRPADLDSQLLKRLSGLLKTRRKYL